MLEYGISSKYIKKYGPEVGHENTWADIRRTDRHAEIDSDNYTELIDTINAGSILSFSTYYIYQRLYRASCPS